MLLHIGLSSRKSDTTTIQAKIYLGKLEQSIVGARLNLQIANADPQVSPPEIATIAFDITERPASNWLQFNVKVDWRRVFRLYSGREMHKASVSANIATPSGQVLYIGNASHIINLNLEEDSAPTTAYPVIEVEPVAFLQPGGDCVASRQQTSSRLLRLCTRLARLRTWLARVRAGLSRPRA